MTVGELVGLLLERFPEGDAESWDRVGLTVGEPGAEVSGVLCALDPSLEAVEEARRRGANVVLAHHPAFLEAPGRIAPAPDDASLAGALVWRAVREGVALVGLHTNLDRSPEALAFFAGLLGLPLLGPATPEGYGALMEGAGMSGRELAERLRDRLGAAPIIWGDAEQPLERVAYLSGSLGSLGEAALERGAGAIVTGEASYHRILELINRKVGSKNAPVVIIIGHDVSEQPYTHLLRDAAAGVLGSTTVGILDEPRRWHLLRS